MNTKIKSNPATTNISSPPRRQPLSLYIYISQERNDLSTPKNCKNYCNIRARRDNNIEEEMIAIETGNSSPAPASIAGVGAMLCAIIPQPCSNATTTMAITMWTKEPPNWAIIAYHRNLETKIYKEHGWWSYGICEGTYIVHVKCSYNFWCIVCDLTSRSMPL